MLIWAVERYFKDVASFQKCTIFVFLKFLTLHLDSIFQSSGDKSPRLNNILCLITTGIAVQKLEVGEELIILKQPAFIEQIKLVLL